MARTSRQATRLHQLRTAVERRLLEIVRDGRPAFDGNGHPVVDEAGNQLRTPPSAADLTVAVKWLGLCGAVHASSGRERPDTVSAIMQRVRERRRLNDSESPIPFPSDDAEEAS